MLKQLRIKLTLLYLLSAVFLALLVGVAAYTLIWYYFQSSNDQALKARVGIELSSQNLPVSKELEDALRQVGYNVDSSFMDPENSSSDEYENSNDEVLINEHLFERQSILADIYILPLTLDGELISGFASVPNYLQVDLSAITAAQINGSDIRTFTNSSRQTIRLFTYFVPGSGPTKVLQAGRFLTSQQKVLNDLLKKLGVAILLETFLFGIGAWLLAGRTIRPSQEAWDKQLAFISNASHELRSPLTLIRAGVELVLRNNHEPDQQRLLIDVLSDADYMKKLIEDLLLISRIDAHEVNVEISSVDLRSLISDLIPKLERVVKERGIRISTSFVNATIRADPVRLKQILLIVFDNAFRNSPDNAEILIETTVTKYMSTIRITDHGQGIPKADLGNVFDRFFKVDNRSTQDYRGIGLGLSIAKGLVEAQKGHIGLTSETGRGTSVSISLPLAENPA